MKTKILTLAIASMMIFQFAKAHIPPQLVWLTPLTPCEATFDEEFLGNNLYPVIKFSKLAPEIPMEATFEDYMPEYQILAPELPTEASMNENEMLEIDNLRYNTLAPAIPAQANFDEAVNDETKTMNIIYSLTPELPVEADFTDAVSEI